MQTPSLPAPPCEFSVANANRVKQSPLLLCNQLPASLSLDLGILFLIRVEACSSGGGDWGEGAGDPRARTSCPDCCQLLAFEQLRAPLTLLRTGWFHSIMISSLGTEQDLIIHYTMDGEGVGDLKKKKKQRKTGIRWSDFTSAPGGC